MVPAVKVVIELAEKLPSIGANPHNRRMTLQKVLQEQSNTHKQHKQQAGCTAV
jgi:hypothetical protein